MKNAWSIEYARIILAVISTMLFAMVSGQALLSIIIHVALYVGWNLYQLKIFEQWVRNGAAIDNAPDTSGIWALIVQHFYRTQKTTKERKKHLANVANHYQAVMSALPDATLVLNDRLEIEWANQATTKLLGIDIDRDIGHPIINIIRDLEVQSLLDSESAEAEIEIASPQDELLTLRLIKLHYGDNKILLIARDISQKIAIQKLRKAFVANASHELRTPLTVISGYLEMLMDDDLPNHVSPLVDKTLGQAKRMEKILNNMLVLSKLEESGKAKSSAIVVDVPVMIERLVNDLKSNQSEKSNGFKLNIDPLLQLNGIEQDFYSLFQNLLTNALKYSDKGSLIEVNWFINSTGKACFSVKDYGEGIAKKHLSRLTERFYRVNVERERLVSGTGLGLSIVKHILDNYGGHLEIESNLGKGSTFTACFPESRVTQRQ